MMNVFAPPILVAVAFCSVMWGYLMIRNFIDLRGWFGFACALGSIAYGIAVYQYISIFFIHKTKTLDGDMWALFVRMLFHCGSVLIFVTHYNLSKKRR